MKKKTTTKVVYAYLDSGARKHLETIAKRFDCSMSKAINALLIANKKAEKPVFTKGTRGSK